MVEKNVLILSDFFKERSDAAPDGPAPEEGLRLIKAFARIADRQRRAAIIDLVEQAAREQVGPPPKPAGK